MNKQDWIKGKCAIKGGTSGEDPNKVKTFLNKNTPEDTTSPTGNGSYYYCKDEKYWMSIRETSLPIVTIDELLEAEFTLPEKWCVKRTVENSSVLNEWNNTQSFYSSCFANSIINSDWFYCDHSHTTTRRAGYTEITFEQFKKYVLKEEEKMYTLDELSSPNIVVFISSSEEWEKLKSTKKFRMTNNYEGTHCYNLFEATYSSSSSESNVGAYKNVTIVKFNQIKFDDVENIIGYKLKEDYKQYKQAALAISQTIANWESTTEKYDISVTQINYISRLKEAEVFDLWFEPIYEEKFQVGDWVWLFGTDNKTYSGNGLNCKEKLVQLLEIDESKNPTGNILKCSDFMFCVNERFYTTDKKWILRKATEEDKNNFFLEEAKKRYPIGTKFKSVINKRTYVVKTNSHKLKGNNIDVDDMPWLYYNEEWAEIIKTPIILVNGYPAEFFDDYVKFGCAKIDKDVFITIHELKGGNSNRDIESITIGKGTFTKEQIKEIAEHYVEE